MRQAFRVAGLCLLPLNLLLLYFLIRHLNTWDEYFFEPGWRHSADNLARLNLLALLFVACWGAGRVVSVRLLDHADTVLIRCLVGFAALSLTGFGLGLAGLLNPWAAIVVLSAALVSAADDQLARSSLGKLRQTWAAASPWPRTFLGFAVLATLVFVVVRVLAMNVLDNDFAHYLPYIDWVRTNGTFGPSGFYFPEFLLKGNGLFHLAAAVSDPVGVQLISFIAMALTVAVAVRIARVHLRCGKLVAGGVGLMIVTTDHLFYSMMEKNHLSVTFLIVGLFYLFVLVTANSGKLNPRVSVAACLVMTALVVSSTSLVPFVVTLLGCFGILALAKGGTDFRKFILPLFAVMSVSVICVLTLNYFSTGLFSMFPFRLNLAAANNEYLSSWISPTAILLSHFHLMAEVQKTFSLQDTGAMGTFFFLVLLALAAVAAAARAIRGKRPDATAWIVVSGSVALLCSLFAIKPLFPDWALSLMRHTLFVWALVPLAALGGLMLTCKWAGRARLPITPDAVVPTAFLVIVMLWTVNFVGTGGQRLVSTAKNSMLMARGASRYGQLGIYAQPECAELSHLLPKGSRVLMLGFHPGCWVMPKVEFLRSDMGPVAFHAHDYLMGTAESQAEAFRSHGIRHFLLPTDVLFPAPFVFSPLFSRDSVAKHFDVFRGPNRSILFRFKNADSAENSVGEDFLTSWADFRENQRESRGAVAYRNLKKWVSAEDRISDALRQHILSGYRNQRGVVDR